MDWINTVNGLIALITGLCGLIGTGIGAFFSIKNLIKAMKEKSSKENWAFIMQIADSAMKEAERSQKEGKDKKQIAISVVKEACKTAGIDISDFIDQLSVYIDQAIAFANDIRDAKKEEE